MLVEQEFYFLSIVELIEDFPVFFVLFTTSILFLLATILHPLSELIRNYGAKEETAEARLTDKWFKEKSPSDKGEVSSSSIYFLEFELSHGEKRNFRVWPVTYSKYKIGECGILKYQRQQFNEFVIKE